MIPLLVRDHFIWIGMEVVKKMEEVMIIGAGPCGLSCALALQKKGMNPLIIEKGNLVDTIYRYPTHQTFFSTSEKLEIGDIPFISEKTKPVRLDALAYYRQVVKRNQLRIQSFEEVIDVKQKANDLLEVHTRKNNDLYVYQAQHVIVATGYYDQPQMLDVPGETLPKVQHYFKEAHPYYGKDVVVIGGKNSAVDTALELEKAAANVTVLYRGSQYSPSIKPWILPGFDSLVQKEVIHLEFNANVTEITEKAVHYEVKGQKKVIANDFVFAMTGYMPNIPLLKRIGIHVNSQSGRPTFNDRTFETNIPNVYVAGVIISGFNGNETFIENGRFHGRYISDAIWEKSQ